MFFLKRLAPFLAGISNLIILELLFFKPSAVWLLATAQVLLIVFLASLIFYGKLNFKSSMRFLLTVFLLGTVGFTSLLFMENYIIKHLLAIVISFLIMIYLEFLFIFLYRPDKYKAFSLENLNCFVNILIYILGSVVLFAFVVYMNLSFYLAILVVTLISSCLLALYYLANKIEIRDSRKELIIGVILLIELFIVLMWLPFTFYIKALLLSSFYYLYSAISRSYLTENVSRKQNLKVIFIFFGVWFICFLTARWT